MKKLILACFLLAAQVQAQEVPGRLLLEAGIDGGNSVACPGHYIGIEGRVTGPVSAYGSVDNYRCLDLAGTTTRVGASLLLGRSNWLVRPAVRGGLAYDGDESFHTVGASLTFGRRYGARFIVDRQPLSSGPALVLIQMGGYITF